MSSTETNESLDSMANEVSSIIKNNICKTVDRTKNKTIIRSCIALRNKLNPDGAMAKKKLC